jgi:uncharacterized protein (TIGR02284 family)
MTTSDTIAHLNELIETCKDGELGYRTAAENVRNTQLETIFSDYSKQREEFARQLHAEIQRLGGGSTDSGTVGATIFRGWMDLKSALAGGGGPAMIASCETGEDSAAAAFERVVDMDISGPAKSLVEKQYAKIKEAHAHMVRLKEHKTDTDFPANE